MVDRTKALPVVLGVITLGVVAYTIRSIMPADPVRPQSLTDKVRAAVRRLDAKKRLMSSADLARAEVESREKDLNDIAVSWTKAGVYITPDQSVRLSKLGDTAIATGSLPSADVDYLLQTIRDPQVGSKSPGYIHFHAAYDLAQMKHFTTDQKNRILQACMPLVKSKAVLDRRCAIIVAKGMHSSAAVPAALDLLHGDNESNRKAARLYLDSLGMNELAHGKVSGSE